MTRGDDSWIPAHLAGKRRFFEPSSISWKVIGHPVSIVGGLRALIIQTLHPLAMAGVAQYSDFRRDPIRRLRGTAAYVAAVVFGDRETAIAAVARVRGLHERVRGIDPVTGKAFAADDPDTMLWVHCVEIHSFLAAYRAYGGYLTLAERDRYFAEQAVAAELIGVPSAMIPRSVAAFRRYFASVRPQLCLSKEAAETIDFVLRPKLSRDVPIDVRVTGRVFGAMAATIVPRDLRRLAGMPDGGVREVPSRVVNTLLWRSSPIVDYVPPLQKLRERMAERIVGETPVRLAWHPER